MAAADVLTFGTIFLSDTHLGTDAAMAERLLEFLSHTDCDELVLVGDIIDGWFLESHKQRPFPEMHRRVLDAIFAKKEQGTRVTLITGNHDGKLRGRAFQSLRARETGFRGIRIVNRLDYNQVISARASESGQSEVRRWRVIHGDHFEPKMFRQNRVMRGLYRAVDYVWANASIAATGVSRVVHDWFRLHCAPLAWLKNAGKSIIGDFLNSAFSAASKREIDGVLCGHIHKAELRAIGSTFYANTGDWVESCTALAIGDDGVMEIIDWAQRRETIRSLQGRRYPRESDPNPYEDQRIKNTLPTLRAIGRLWGGTNRPHLFERVREIRTELEKGNLAAQYTKSAGHLTDMADRLALHLTSSFDQAALEQDRKILSAMHEELKVSREFAKRMGKLSSKLNAHRASLFPGKYAPDGTLLPHRL